MAGRHIDVLEVVGYTGLLFRKGTRVGDKD